MWDVVHNAISISLDAAVNGEWCELIKSFGELVTKIGHCRGKRWLKKDRGTVAGNRWQMLVLKGHLFHSANSFIGVTPERSQRSGRWDSEAVIVN